MPHDSIEFLIANEQVVDLLQKHGFDTGELARSQFHGEANFVWLTTDVALRVSTMPCYELDAKNEKHFVPIAVAAGMPCPKLLVLDDDRDIVPTIATIYERVEGVPFGAFDLSASKLAGIAEQLAAQLHHLHLYVSADLAPDTEMTPDFDEVLGKAAGVLSPAEYEWAAKWSQCLAEIAPSTTRRFLHGDIHSMNILVDDGISPSRLTALLDWSDCASGDVAQEFAMLPPHLIPLFVRSYQNIYRKDDETFEGRVIGFMLQSILYVSSIEITGLPLYYRGRPAWDSMLRLLREEADPQWTKWFPATP